MRIGLLVGAFMFGLTVSVGANASPLWQNDAAQSTPLIQIADADDKYDVEQGGTYKGKGNIPSGESQGSQGQGPRQTCTKEERRCTEWLPDGKCKLWGSVTVTYSC